MTFIVVIFFWLRSVALTVAFARERGEDRGRVNLEYYYVVMVTWTERSGTHLWELLDVEIRTCE